MEGEYLPTMATELPEPTQEELDRLCKEAWGMDMKRVLQVARLMRKVKNNQTKRIYG